ncbi:hypothetical protein KI688_002957 [Linnemannia hyalina]|uniref:F-box domain-containing protein n=1 Tax=Linnemannia hyalina TaxID=64524 RepID=A0A9P7XQA5_9FUNG|nr:hypothetical protein KI688_002957 [Linnemannia hyalina]
MREFSKLAPGESKSESVISEAQKTVASLTGTLYRRLQSMTNLEYFQRSLLVGEKEGAASMGPGTFPGMDSACARFFKATELVAMVAMLLPKKSIVHLMLTSKRLNKISSPYLYHTLDLEYLHKALCTSPDALLALSACSRSVRDITMPDDFFFQYYRGIITLQDLQHTVSGTSPSLPPWLPPIDFRTTLVVPFPPMSDLQALSCSTSRCFTSDTSAFTSLYHNGGYLALVCYVVQLSPRLTRLTLHDLPTFCMDDINLLARTLNGLTQLQELHTSLLSTADVLDHTISTIFFSLPQSIRIFNLNLCQQYKDPATFDRGVRTTQGPVSRRQEPLLNLTHWQVQTFPGFMDDTFRSMIQQCPALVQMEMPNIRVIPKIIRPGLAQFIVNHCPSLHTLSWGNDTYGQEEQEAMAIMNAMPRDTLRALEFKEFTDRSGELGEAIERHAASLTAIVIEYAELTEDTIQTILIDCEALEVFDIETESCYYSVGEIHLADLVAIPWASTRLRTLKLIVNIGDTGILRSSLYLRDAPVLLSDEEQDQLSFLNILYRQIGMLTELEHLSLIISVPDEDEEEEDENLTGWNRYVFPGMLTLDGDKTKGLPGFLGLLSGLKKLKILEGFVNVSTKETKATMGWKEVEWIRENWPRLKRAEFFDARGLKNLKELVGSVSAYTRETRLALGQAEMEWMVEQWPKLERIELEPPRHPKLEEHGDCGSRSDDGCLHWLQSKRPKLKVQCR